jgi:hypothetical protein
MPRLLVLAFIALAACNNSDAGEKISEATPDPSGWQLASGKPPTKAEFAAVVASCEERGKGAFDSCLADLGLRRAP